MAKLIPLEYQGMPIQANSDAWFNATDMAAIYGKKYMITCAYLLPQSLLRPYVMFIMRENPAL